MTDLRDPGFRYVFRLADGGVVQAHPRDAIRVLDKRTPQSDPATVWEVRVNGVIRRLWPEEIVSVEQEAVG